MGFRLGLLDVLVDPSAHAARALPALPMAQFGLSGVRHHWRVSPRHRSPSRTTRPIRRDYLRSFGDDIDAALALIVRDIVATGALTADEAGAAVRIQAAFHLEDQVENGVEPRADETALWVAE